MPDIYYLKDASGNLIAVPDLSLEDYQRWLQQQAHGPLPPYALNSVTVFGWVEGDRSELEVRIELRVDRSVGQAMAVPLRLFPATLLEYRYEGLGQTVVAFDRTASSYVWYLQASPGTRHQLLLRLMSPVTSQTQRRRLELALPDALTHIELLLDQPRIEYGVTSDSFLTKTPLSVGPGHSKVEMDGYGGTVALWWRAMAEGPQAIQPYLTAATQVTLVVQDPLRYRLDVLCDVRAERGPWDVFHIQMPVGGHLVVQETVGYQLQWVEGADGASGPLVRVVRTSQQDRPVLVSIAAEVRRSSATLPWNAAAFGIPEAYYQRVELAVRVEGDWAVRAAETRQVRRVSSLLPEERQQGIVAKYVFYPSRTAPPLLNLLVQPQQSVLSIEPHYLVRFVGNRAWLDLFLRCRVHGAPARGFELWTGTWNVRSLLPQDWIEPQAAPPPADPSVLTVFLAADRLPGQGHFDLHLMAETAIDLSRSEALVLALPTPRSSPLYQDQLLTVLPGVVVVQGEPDIELIPVPSLMPHLVSVLPSAADWLLSQFAALPEENRFVFQRLGLDEPLRVAFMVRPRPQAVRVEVNATVTPEPDALRVVQQWKLLVAHQPLDTVTFTVTGRSEKPTDIQFWVDEQPVNRAAVVPENGADRWQVPLPAPWLGSHTVRTSYRVLNRDVASEARRTIPLLVMDPKIPVIDAVSEISVPEQGASFPYALEINTEQPIGDTTGGQRVWRVSRLLSELVLHRYAAGAWKRSIHVDRAWIQTVFTGQYRLDRCAFRIRGLHGPVHVSLPEQLPLRRDDVTVALNGKLWSRWAWSSQRTIRIDCDVPTPDAVLEIWYLIDYSPDVWDIFRLQLPTIEDASAIYTVRWELAVPGRYHLMLDPPGLIAEYSWQWQGAWFARHSSLTTRQLEDWVGAVHGPALPAGMNRYVFASLGVPGPVRVMVAGRATLIVTTSLIVLLIGWLYQRWVLLRRWIFVVVGVAVIVVALGRVDLGVLAGQAALVGFVALLIIRMVQASFVRTRPPVRSGRVSSIVTLEPAVPATAATVSLTAMSPDSPSGALHP